MEPIFGILMVLFSAMFVTVGYKLGHEIGIDESKCVCVRMLEYEQHMTAEQAYQTFSNELKRDGR